MITLFRNAKIFDGHSEEILDGGDVVVENGFIREVAENCVSLPDATVIDCKGRYLMPGLIDCHFHAYSPSMNISVIEHMPLPLLAAHAAKVLEGTLTRGFTTVRDAAGGDIGLWMAIEQCLIKGPRFFFPGKAISQTGGHGDIRPANERDICGCGGYRGSMTLVADGAEAVRAAVREELRKGAHQIKIFVSGGALSPTDPMWMPQFTEEEIRAAVYEASTRRTYVMAHSHTDDSSRRCSEYGVRTIEHGTLICEDETARIIAKNGTYVVPTLSVSDVLRRHVDQLNLAPAIVEKINSIDNQALRAIEVCSRAGVKLGFGTDLLDHAFHPFQGGEFELRGQVSKAVDVLRSATSINAEILQMPDQLGCIKAGAFADILVLEGDPFADLSLFREPRKNIPVIMKNGVMVRNDLP
jgi:imidazolonepropionase-like amidohydrolase